MKTRTITTTADLMQFCATFGDEQFITVDTEFIRGLRADFDEAKALDKVLSPDAIAAQYVALHKQHRSAWTHELDLRPWAETF